VLANNLHGQEARRDQEGLTRSNPDVEEMAHEMTRWSLASSRRTPVSATADVANRMADFGIDPYWMSHEPWSVPEPFTPEAGEMYSKEDLDQWIAVIARIVEEAYADAPLVKSAPHARRSIRSRLRRSRIRTNGP